MNGNNVYTNDQRSTTLKRCIRILFYLFLLECYLNFLIIYYKTYTPYTKKDDYVPRTESNDVSMYVTRMEGLTKFTRYAEELLPREYYKYPMINSTNATMDYENHYNSSYYWFVAMKEKFKNLGYRNRRRAKPRPFCKLNVSTLGPIKVDKSVIRLKLIAKQNRDVRLGGFHAPKHCRSNHRVAVLVPYRGRRENLFIFMRYIHTLLKKQLLRYRIFVIEQYGMEKFNKGILYNIGFLETQRFGFWDCLIFHDVDLIPTDERILYSCSKNPQLMSPIVEIGVNKTKELNFGGVISMTRAHYISVNGYSNFYWNSRGDSDDFYNRLRSYNYTIGRYDSSMARYVSLPHRENNFENQRNLFLLISKLGFQKEGLRTTKYNIISITLRKLYTHILADVNPTRMKLDEKTLMRQAINLQGKTIEYGRQELGLKSISVQELHHYLISKRKEAHENEMTTLTTTPDDE